MTQKVRRPPLDLETAWVTPQPEEMPEDYRQKIPPTVPPMVMPDPEYLMDKLADIAHIANALMAALQGTLPDSAYRRTGVRNGMAAAVRQILALKGALTVGQIRDELTAQGIDFSPAGLSVFLAKNGKRTRGPKGLWMLVEKK